MRTAAKSKTQEKVKRNRRTLPVVEAEILAGLTPLKRSLLTRDIQFLAKILSPIPDERLEDAASQIDSYASLTAQLSQPEAQVALSESADPWEEFSAAGLGESRALLTERGECLSVAQVAKLLNISRQAVDQRRQKGQLFALEAGRRGYAYPPWQFTSTGTVAGLNVVMQLLSATGADAWEMLAFFLSPNSATRDKAPIDLLLAGRLADRELVTRAAELHGKQGPE